MITSVSKQLKYQPTSNNIKPWQKTKWKKLKKRKV